MVLLLRLLDAELTEHFQLANTQHIPDIRSFCRAVNAGDCGGQAPYHALLDFDRLVRAPLACGLHCPESIYLGIARQLYPASPAYPAQLHLVRGSMLECRAIDRSNAHSHMAFLLDNAKHIRLYNANDDKPIRRFCGLLVPLAAVFVDSA